ncbi:MAG: spermidine synthase [Bifidobacteriaceae bacterium]|nr:spermidine synthase [Bifidobacteriaceae bacterium]
MPLRNIPTEPFAVASGQARFEVEGDSVTLYINALPSSQFSFSSPTDFEFEYMRWMFAACEVTFSKTAAPRALHLGAGGCALARGIAHRWRDSRHLAVDTDAELAKQVRTYLPLPRKPVLRLRVADAAQTLSARPPASHDLIIRDVFAADGTMDELWSGAQAAAWAASALRTGGLFLANRGERPPGTGARAELRALMEQFAYTAVIAEPGLLRGRRKGNLVLVARHEPLDGAAEATLARKLRMGAVPARLIVGAEAQQWAGRADRNNR